MTRRSAPAMSRQVAPAVAAALLALLVVPAGVRATSEETVQGPPTSTVVRLAGPNRAATAAAIAGHGWDHADQVVLVPAADPQVALLGAHLAARIGAPVLLSGELVPPETQTEVDRLDPSELVVVGGVAAPPGVSTTELDAPDPIGLAAELATMDLSQGNPDTGDGSVPEVVLATSAAVADALAAANLAPTRILLTGPDQLAPQTRQALDELAPDRVVVLGGTAAVPEAVVAEVRATGTPVQRIAGDDRIGTALEAAARTGVVVALASAWSAADAVAVVPWLARAGGALLLTGLAELPGDVEIRLRGIDYRGGVVLGGTAAVGNFAERQATAALDRTDPPGFVGTARPLTTGEQEAMTGVTWREGCPVPLADLQAVEVSHWGPDGNVVDDGLLVVHRDVAEDTLAIFGAAFDARFPLWSVAPAVTRDGDDDRLMADNVTSAFNCRTVAGTSTWSTHAYGRAIDVNPVQNPYVRGQTVQPAAGAAFLDRSDVRPGMLVEGGAVIATADALGWGWGGRWQSSSDFQHLSQTGR